MPKALRYLAAGGERAASQGGQGGDRMWERWDIRLAGDPVEWLYAHSTGWTVDSFRKLSPKRTYHGLPT